MTDATIAHLRLHNQQIASQSLATPADVVSWLGAMQGQDYTGVKWSVGLRMPAATDAAIEQALRDRTIVRTWPLRGTLHFVTASDVRWILALMAPRLIAGNAGRYRQLELDEATLLRSNDLIVSALRDGQPHTRKSLLAILEANGISTAGQRAPHILQRASLDGLICQGEAVRNDPTYMLLDGALPRTRPLVREEALAELAARYFASRGPATLQDFAWWSGLKITDARAGLKAVESRFVSEIINGQTYWLPAATPSVPHDQQALYLLSGFDEYLLGYRDRSAVLDPHYADRIVPGGNGVFYPTIVIGGRVVGVWKRVIKKGGVTVVADPFEPLSASQQAAFEAAARRYASYLEMPLAKV